MLEYLTAGKHNGTQTGLAEVHASMSHDAVNRLLRAIEIDSDRLWREVHDTLPQCEDGCILFDDTVLDKPHGMKIEMARRQYSGNAGRVVRGIGVITCIYLNPHTQEWRIIDYRFYDPDHDGKGKMDHVLEMIDTLENRGTSWKYGLCDSWYASVDVLMKMANLGKVYYTAFKPNRTARLRPETSKIYAAIDTLAWTPEQEYHGMSIRAKGFPADHPMKLFKVPVSSNRTDFVVTNDPDCHSLDDASSHYKRRWAIECFHREVKQLTAVERCQCRKRTAQRNHIGLCILAWIRLKHNAQKCALTTYQYANQWLTSALQTHLKNPYLTLKSA